MASADGECIRPYLSYNDVDIDTFSCIKHVKLQFNSMGLVR